ncbi:MAG: 2-phosphoglycerate kinase [Candidatus Howiella sp.]
MILLIGGESCTGKTLLAQRLLETCGVPYLSADHVKMGMIRGGLVDFTAEDDDNLICGRLWGVLSGILKTAVENRQHLIMEGCYFRPELTAGLEERYRGVVREVYLGFSEGYIRAHYADILAYRNTIERRLYPEDRSVDDLIAAHRALRAACADCVGYFEVQRDYAAEITALTDRLTADIREQIAAEDKPCGTG